MPDKLDRLLEQNARSFKPFDLKKERELIARFGVSLIPFGAGNYPETLKNIASPPAVLYCRGTLTPEDARGLAIVGSRTPTRYGEETARRLAKDLARRAVTVVSGLAYGIDAAAHAGALEAGGRTIAVLGQGLGTPVYPPENGKLAERIAGGGGAVISEFPMTAPPLPRNFPRRNRIVSGLSLGVLVVEAARKSGAMITTDFALEQGKPVFAVPGRIDSPLSEGPNSLIQQGAKLVAEARDILEELFPEETAAREPADSQKIFSFGSAPFSPEEKILISRLTSEEKQLELLLQETSLPLHAATQALFSLELKNLVKQLPGQYYVRL